MIELQEAFEDLRDQDNEQLIDILIEGKKQIEIRVIDINGAGKPGTYTITDNIRDQMLELDSPISGTHYFEWDEEINSWRNSYCHLSAILVREFLMVCEGYLLLE